MTENLKGLYEAKSAYLPEEQKGYERFMMSRESKLCEYQKCVNDMDLKENPFTRFDGYVKKYHYKQRRSRAKPLKATVGVESGSSVEGSAL